MKIAIIFIALMSIGLSLSNDESGDIDPTELKVLIKNIPGKKVGHKTILEL